MREGRAGGGRRPGRDGRTVRVGRPYPGPRFYSVSARLEGVLIQSVIALGLVCVLGQFLLTVPAARYVMSYVDRLEGVALDPGGASVTIVLASGSPGQGARLFVNGRQAGTFATGMLWVQVSGGDLIEVDGSGLTGEGRFEVVASSGGVSAPAVGLKVTTRRGAASLGRVEFETGGGR